MTRPGRVAAGSARAYHDATKHSWQSVRSDRHRLDWEIKPNPFKLYLDAPAVPLPRDVQTPTLPALQAVADVTAPTGTGRLDLPVLAQLLFFSAGLTKKKVYPGGDTVYFRAAASTGALYEVEVYVVAGVVPGLEPGVYHFAPGDFTLRRLRRGDYRAALADASAEPTRMRAAPAILVLSAIYWRNTWKYQARAFRHFFWDAGTLLANLLADAVALDVSARVWLGFADEAVNRLLGLDASRETSLALVSLGSRGPSAPDAPPIEPLDLRTAPLSSRDVDYPLVREAYFASSLPDGAAARRWAGESPEKGTAHRQTAPQLESRPLGDTIMRRGSTREFARESIARAELSAMLDAAVRELPLDASGPPSLVDTYLLAHAVTGVDFGAYVYDPAERGLRLLRTGEFRAEGGHLCLEQPLGANASAVVFFLSDLRAVGERYGDRGYRAVNLAAGLLGGRLYLAAYGLGLGASGLTFYDDDVVRFFSPDAAGKDAIFVVALGRARRLARSHGFGSIEGAIHLLRPGQR